LTNRETEQSAERWSQPTAPGHGTGQQPTAIGTITAGGQPGAGPAPARDATVQRRWPRARRQPDYQRRARRLFLAPLSVVLGAVTIVPFVVALGLSLTNANPLNHSTKFVGLGNYGSLATDGSFGSAVLITIVFTAVTVAIELGLGIAVAVALNRLRRGGALLRTLLLIPMAAAPIAVMYDWQLMLNAMSGVINYVLGIVGLPQPNWLGSPHFALPTLISIDVWEWTPFIMVIIVGGLSAIPGEVYEAAKVDGAAGLQQFLRITLPLLRPYIMVAVLFRAIDALKTFDSIQVLTSGGPGTSTTSINYYAFRSAINNLQFGRGTAAAMCLLVIAMLLSKLLISRLREQRATRAG
jgi:multiple sugar transport system permease protein